MSGYIQKPTDPHPTLPFLPMPPKRGSKKFQPLRKFINDYPNATRFLVLVGMIVVIALIVHFVKGPKDAAAPEQPEEGPEEQGPEEQGPEEQEQQMQQQMQQQQELPQCAKTLGGAGMCMKMCGCGGVCDRSASADDARGGCRCVNDCPMPPMV